MSIRLAALMAAAALLCACGGPKSSTAGSGPAGAVAGGASVPVNAPVTKAGLAGGIPLDASQRAELDATVAKAPAAQRPRLRYALASGDDGKAHLVVYDGGGLGAEGRHPGRKHQYTVFRVLNAATPIHYDPQQNSLVAPIPPPPQRESAVTR
jgi:hypothetical protein